MTIKKKNRLIEPKPDLPIVPESKERYGKSPAAPLLPLLKKLNTIIKKTIEQSKNEPKPRKTKKK